MRHAFVAPTALAERSTVPCRSPYDLLAPIRTLRQELCLTPSDLTVLTALISFLPRDNWDKADDSVHFMTIVFPSNTALSERANGMDERTLRRAIGRLTASELIERKSSSNGKRFPIRYNGVIRDAFGFDLQPLIEQHVELTVRAAKAAEERERLRSLKAEALALRSTVLNRDDLNQEELSSLKTMRNVLRRATLTVETLLRLMQELRKLAADAKVGYGERTAAERPDTAKESHERPLHLPTIKTDDLSATNGQNDRHTESNNIDIKKRRTKTAQIHGRQQNIVPSMNRNPKTMTWDEFKYVAEFFPKPPRSGEALTRIILELGKLLRISQAKLLHWLNKTGAGRVLLAFDYIIARAKVIKEPNAYFETILKN